MRLYVLCKGCRRKINLDQTVEERRFVSSTFTRSCDGLNESGTRHTFEYHPHNVYSERHLEFSLRSIFMASIIAFVFTLALGDLKSSLAAIAIAALFRAWTDYIRCTGGAEIDRINRFNTSTATNNPLTT